ncbi:MAG: NAD(P)-dependent glycerol-3-phosphate dehydrogenase [Elusimicrobiota bacterium]|jgi:glycerol-3-phosphate dehydrogenase (NAD(P)+)|nr:NAD(P)-dependent glycerol-3-phosphate dehydrogenase [Elusimicrobiota bacterium]
MQNDIKNVAILGLGSWGMAIALVLNDNKCNINIWDVNSKRIKILDKTKKFDLLDWIKIPKQIKLLDDMKETIQNSDLIIFAVPSNAIRDVAEKLKKVALNNKINLNRKVFLSVAKGIEYETYNYMTDIIGETLNIKSKNLFALSGPSHAEEVSKKIPTTVCISGENKTILKKLQKTFSNNYFRVYITNDLKGLELGGAAKNIIAIAAGIVDSIGLGDNTKAALITRGLLEIARLGKKLGTKTETFYGLSGLGDLIVTCISRHSRNRYFGEQLGKGKTTKKILSEMNMVAEGVLATKSIYNLAKKHKVEMPIVTEIYNVIYKNKSPKTSVINLMQRELKEEKFL